MTKQTKKPAPHKYLSLSIDSLIFPKHKVNPTSNNPAIIRIIQFISPLKIRNVVLLFLRKPHIFNS